MLARVCAVILGLLLLAPPAGAQFGRGNRLPGLVDLQQLMAMRGMEAPTDIVRHRCERRPSALYGRDTFRCEVTLTTGNELVLVVTAFDGAWVVAGQR